MSRGIFSIGKIVTILFLFFDGPRLFVVSTHSTLVAFSLVCRGRFCSVALQNVGNASIADQRPYVILIYQLSPLLTSLVEIGATEAVQQHMSRHVVATKPVSQRKLDFEHKRPRILRECMAEATGVFFYV